MADAFYATMQYNFCGRLNVKENISSQILRSVLKIALHTIRSFITFYGNSHALNSNPRAREYFITFHTLYTESKIRVAKEFFRCIVWMKGLPARTGRM